MSAAVVQVRLFRPVGVFNLLSVVNVVRVASAWMDACVCAVWLEEHSVA